MVLKFWTLAALGLTDPPSTKSWVGLGAHQMKGTTQVFLSKEP